MIIITGTVEDVENFIDALVCPKDDNVGTLETCPKEIVEPGGCIDCVIEAYKIEIEYI